MTTLLPLAVVSPAGSAAGQVLGSNGPSLAPSWLTPSKTLVGLPNVDNTSDINKPVSTPQATALALKAPLASPTFSGTATIPAVNAGALALTESSNNTNTIQVVNTGTNGANVKLIGNGATTPNKTIRVNGGLFQILNNGYSASILDLDDSGNLKSYGSFIAVGSITPSQTAGIVGTTTNNNANAGSVGEYPAPTNLTAIPLTSGAAANVSSIVLQPGDWEVSGVIRYTPAGSTAVSTITACVSTTSAALSGFPNQSQISASFVTGFTQDIASPTVRISVSVATTVYLVAYAGFVTSTMTANGSLHVRRAR